MFYLWCRSLELHYGEYDTVANFVVSVAVWVLSVHGCKGGVCLLWVLMF